MGRGLGNAWEAWQSAGWPTTTGTVLSATLESHTGRHGPSYTPRITYSYTVNGASLTGTMIAPGRMWNGNAPFAVVKKFPAGSHPAIAYSPAQPGQSVLMPGLHFSTLEPALLGLLGFTFAAFFGVFSYLGPRYGQPDGRGGYNFNSGPAGAAFLVGFFLIFAEFALVWMAASAR